MYISFDFHKYILEMQKYATINWRNSHYVQYCTKHIEYMAEFHLNNNPVV